MQEISEDDIAALDDAALRSLVLRLCEAEVERAGLPRIGVTGGGHQDARDGGVDVRVSLDRAPGGTGFVPRAETIFQVKKPDLAGRSIGTEMRPEGTLRPAIAELAACGGAYVIVSGRASVTDTALQQRIALMRAAVADLPGADALHLDYLDRGRLATWVRAYPAIAAWMLSRLGREERGWQGHGPWANAEEPADAPYLLDDHGRMIDGTAAGQDLLTTGQGIDRLRQVLREPRASVRLVGLSGMGKTRLVQALFDERVGTGALPRSQVVYGDTGRELAPSPEAMLTRLIQGGQRVVLIIDNCNAGTHEALTKLCKESTAQVSLLTVEYDIQDDLPEKTAVFRLHSASPDIIEAVLRANAPHVGEGDRRRIADLSDGNARVALALARTLARGETLAGMKDGEVFRRLLHQRRPEDKGLERAAQILSLVYSFHIGEGDGTKEEKAELSLLADLAGLDVDTLYRHVAELARRGIVQSRGPWRAVLPQAIALRLAAQALEDVRRDRIEEMFWTRAHDRLRRSFCRRLGHLHDSPKAVAMVEDWMAAGGRLHGFADGFGETLTMFELLAPVSPGAALTAMEREWPRMAVSHFGISRDRYASLLRSIAYEVECFRRAVLMLVRLLTHEPERPNNSTAENIFKDLFHMIGSGTQAPPELRLAVLDELLRDPNPAVQAYGIVGLDAMLRVRFFFVSGGHDFGARARDQEWRATNSACQWGWYRAAISKLCNIGLSIGQLRRRARQVLASHLRELWQYEALQPDLLSLASQLHREESWVEGWLAVRAMTAWKMSHDQPIPETLRDLESLLRAADLRSQIRAYVEQDRRRAIELFEARHGDKDHEAAMRNASDMARELGRLAAVSDRSWLCETLSDVHSAANGHQQEFGEGLADGDLNVSGLGALVIETFRALPASDRHPYVLYGYLRRANDIDPDWVEGLLDQAILDSDLGPVFPILQAAVGFEGAAYGRLIKSVAAGLAPPGNFRTVVRASKDRRLSPERMAVLIEAIAERPDGLETAIMMSEIVLNDTPQQGVQQEPILIGLGRRLLEKWRPESENYTTDYYIIRLCEMCFTGPEGEAPARSFLRNLLAHTFLNYALGCLIYGVPVCKAHPRVALDELLGGPTLRLRHWLDLDDDPDSDLRSAIASIAPEIIMAWADDDPMVHYPRLGAALPPFRHVTNAPDEPARPELSPEILDLLSRAPDPVAFLDALKPNLTPNSWSGSRADTIDRNLDALRPLLTHDRPEVRAWAERTIQELAQAAAEDRAREERNQRARNLRFE